MNPFRKLLSKRSLLLLGAVHLSALCAESDCLTDHRVVCCNLLSCLPIAGDATIAFDDFRSVPEGSWEGNVGALISLNLGAPLPLLSRGGLGIQLGGSYGLYDWSGRGSALAGSDKSMQQQGFATVAIFRRAQCGTGINLALAYDRMFNDKFGVFALDPSLSQVRYQVSYLLRCRNEFGAWGTAYTNTAHKSTVGIPVAFRAINQINLFWRHFFKNCTEAMIWGGVPFGSSLMFFSRPGEYTLGASFQAPLARCWAVSGHAAYMHAPSAPGPIESRNYASNVCIGITYLFGGSSRCVSRARAFRPYLPVANNSNFLVDTSVNY